MMNNSEKPQLVIDVPWLEPFNQTIEARIQKFKEWQAKIDKTEGGLDPFSKGYEKFGLIAQADRSILYCKWAPGAQNASLIGDFNNWDREANPMKKDQFGVWECWVPPKGSQPGIAHGSKVYTGKSTSSQN
ncbi:alpha-1,4-glucan branching enzyme [Puccinia graminis f. sp. tritici]|uniref:Alpha-1,4-glucan branching enzyme n=1 Tax=Puccinia graminis f. sp. tritici TaxID=56615 RepID=A0A5B0PCM9_PUCGR|nr:alpha-1,4-glucan branching enzyme [Puccinia graminis f. sp. tritici]KAA1134022.1 alpha-1,4-glucan branching enzyme [Puccinia graminis f. sp. tritici]